MQDVRWCIHGEKDRGGQQYAEQCNDEACEGAEENRTGKGTLQLFLLAGTVILTHIDGGTDAESGDTLDEENGNRVGNGYGAERSDAGAFADDDGIDRIIGELKEVSEYQWDGIGQKVAVNTAACHVSHSNSLLFKQLLL